ncbi:MAG TPA: alanine racemase [Thermoanaerobaculia bacterium]
MNAPASPHRLRSTRAVVDLDAVASNARLLRRKAGDRPLCAVVKADAYGHGAVPVARRLEREGVERFAVASLEEGIGLRRGGVTGAVVVLGGAWATEAALCEAYGLTPAIHDVAQARGLAEATASFGRPLPVEVELDTGMGRLGVRPELVRELAGILQKSRGLMISGVYTQLASGEDPAPEPTHGQLASLSAGLEVLRRAGIRPGSVHAANSGGILAHPEASADAVRPGVSLYGILPSESLPDPGLVPAMEIDTRVLAVREVPAGTPLGYGGAFTTRRPSRIATLPIGYHDGLRRSFSGKIAVLLGGGRAPVVGVVSMDLTLIDATDSGAAPGDRAVLLGRVGSEAVTAWDLARAAGTIPYEILCGVGSRVPREYGPHGGAA